MPDLTVTVFDAVFGVALTALVWAVIQQRTEIRRLRRLIRAERDDRASLADDVAALLACSRNIGEKVRAQDRQQYTIARKLDVIDLYRETSGGGTYDQVRKMLQQGMSIDEIAEICDLQRGELELLSHIASHRSAA